ncbi:MAG: tRNA (adenosine(37)-N6)-threonylcarbamoyltransferase complex dimerization subunit type 1 TsaB [Actinomycetota bacterium]
MIILAIDTSTDAVSVAVNNSKKLLASAHVASNRRHAEQLVPMIETVCRQADIDISEVDVVAVDVGPGLFTGMRVGIASAKSIAQVLNVPIIGVSSLDILARSVSTTDRVVVSTIDARRGEFYWALYRNDVGSSLEVKPPRVGTFADCVVDIVDRGQDALIVGNGALRYKYQINDQLETTAVSVEWASEQLSRPDATLLALIAADLALHEQWQTAAQLQALYLRAPDAEINWLARSQVG